MVLSFELTAFHALAAVLVAFMAAAGALHALLHKRDSRAALGWVAVCLLFPAFGPLLYILFGVNRIHTRAAELERERSFQARMGTRRAAVLGDRAMPADGLPAQWAPIARVSDALAARPLVGSNCVEALFNGAEAYPAMLDAIEGARHTLYLCTYIFLTDEVGQRFVDALVRARRRGVDVRVIVDGVGELYAWPNRASRALARARVPVARFLPPRLLPPSVYINLRNHRKVLVADGATGFTGGMNIAAKYDCGDPPGPGQASDVHFRLTGPIAYQLEHAFLEDWRFCTGEEDIPEPAGVDMASGNAACRVIADGPHRRINQIAAVFAAAVTHAEHRVTIVTPYFLPSRDLLGALQTAALRGVEVSLVFPEKNNLRFVHWATRNMLWELLDVGVNVYYQPPPFSHTKLFVVDDYYLQMGSANLDPRSLRLNFELNVEIFDLEIVARITAHVDRLCDRSRRISLEEIDRRTLPARVRDSVAWLFSPYL